jgi:hypothetical protein
MTSVRRLLADYSVAIQDVSYGIHHLFAFRRIYVSKSRICHSI